jgi:uncharacterized membrane protein
MGSGAYLAILAIGIIIVLIDGQMIMRKAPEYLDEVYENKSRSKKVTQMVAGLFHLIMLGVVFLVSSIGLDIDAGLPQVLSRVGVMFLLTAVGHGITMLVLSRLREQELATQVAEHDLHRDEHHGA